MFKSSETTTNKLANNNQICKAKMITPIRRKDKRNITLVECQNFKINELKLSITDKQTGYNACCLYGSSANKT